MSQRIRYAIRVLTALAARRESRISARAIAEEYDIPPKYLETILGDLRSAGLVRSTKGATGGYELAAEPSATRLADIVAAVEGELFTRLYDAGRGKTDASRHPEAAVMDSISAELAARLRNTNIADAMMLWQEARRTIDYVI
ncbi:MAG: Rrf2 family transcriptional regulator [Spirochaetales bacterium]|nr:Rrf2 family transcriptional regulator [Spirochaetales bacterium]